MFDSFLVMIGSGVLGWALYPLFVSKSEKWRTFPFTYFSKRLTGSIGVMFLVAVFYQSSQRSVEPTAGANLESPHRGDSPVPQAPEASSESIAKQSPSQRLTHGRPEDSDNTTLTQRAPRTAEAVVPPAQVRSEESSAGHSEKSPEPAGAGQERVGESPLAKAESSPRSGGLVASIGAATSTAQTWVYKSYKRPLGGQYDKANYVTGTIAIVERDGKSFFRMTAGDVDVCLRGQLRANVEKTADTTIVEPQMPVAGCERFRYVIRNDGSGGRREVWRGERWVDTKLDHGLTPAAN